MQRLVLNIEGMNGNSCERKLCKRVCRLNGIKGVSAKADEGTLVTYYDEKSTDIKALLDSVTECGFTVI